MSNVSTSRTLGLWMLTALVAGNMIGSGVFLLPAALANFGSISILAWILTAIGAIFIALIFAKLSSLLPRAGGPYTYCHEAFGDFTGFQVAYNYWIAVWVGNSAIAVAGISYLAVFWPALKTNNQLAGCLSIAMVWLVTVINMIGVRQAGIFQLITTILKLIPLILIALFGLFFIHPQYIVENFNISHQSSFYALSGAATLTLWSFIGLESATIPTDSVKDPQKNVPLATILGVIITAMVYIFSTIAVMGVIPMAELAKSSAPYADAAQKMFGHTAYFIVAIGAIISCFGALNGWTLLQGQIPFSASKDGIFPAFFSKESRYNNPNNPTVGLLISSLLITVLLLLTYNTGRVHQFTLIILIATLASLIPYFYTALAEILLLIKYKDKFNHKRFAGTVMISTLGAAYAFWAIAGSGQEILFYGSLLFFSGIPVYVWMRWHSSKLLVMTEQTMSRE